MINGKEITVSFYDGTTGKFPKGIDALEMLSIYGRNFSSPVVGAFIDNELYSLRRKLFEDCHIRFVKPDNVEGIRILQYSLTFILLRAFKELFPDKHLVLDHSISKGFYFHLREGSLKKSDISRIHKQMQKIIDADEPFLEEIVSKEKAIKIFGDLGQDDKVNLIENLESEYLTIYSSGKVKDLFLTPLLPSTGYYKIFDLVPYSTGMILLFPDFSQPKVLPEYKEQKKLYEIFQEYGRWQKIVGIENVAQLNCKIKENKMQELVLISEALHEKKISDIADDICKGERDKHPQIILISGPSSSGKTTFSKRLTIHLQVIGKKPFTINMDDFFLPREQTPKDKNGNYDFESLYAIDLELFNNILLDLLSGRGVHLPKFSFAKGDRTFSEQETFIDEGQIIIIEGIHALNKKLTESVPDSLKYKIYISALSQLNIDDHNRIATTDTRLIRRIIRDYQFRNYSPEDTIKRWNSVRLGEEKNIFPFQEEADIMFNSALLYEYAALKPMAEKALSSIEQSVPQYGEAKRLLQLLSYFCPIDSSLIPRNSILCEFLGSSFFKY